MLSKGKINGPVSGNLDKSYVHCSKCKVRRPKAKMCILTNGSDVYNTTYLCPTCSSGVKA